MIALIKAGGKNFFKKQGDNCHHAQFEFKKYHNQINQRSESEQHTSNGLILTRAVVVAWLSFLVPVAAILTIIVVATTEVAVYIASRKRQGRERDSIRFFDF